MNKVFKAVLIAFATLALVLAIGGALLSPRYHVERHADIAATPAAVYALVADPRRWAEWSAWNRRDPAMQTTYTGPASGSGAGWSWESRSEGNGRMLFTAAEPDRRVAFELAFPDFGTSARGELRLQPTSTGTRVDWTLDGDAGRNLFWRWMTLLMDRFVGRDFEQGLANLKALAERH